MSFDRSLAAAALAGVDPGRMQGSLAVGLRDGAVLALAAAGLDADEIAGLRASDVRFADGRIFVNLAPPGRLQVLRREQGARLLAWLTERGIVGKDELVFAAAGQRGPLTRSGVIKIVARAAREAR